MKLLLNLEVLAQEIELALSFCAVYLVLALYFLVMHLQPFTDVMVELHFFFGELIILTRKPHVLDNP